MDLRYPRGRFDEAEANKTPLPAVIDEIAALPETVRQAVAGLTMAQVDSPYREGGWTARQVVHHLADSHVNCYVRFRLALTEHRPAVIEYDEKAWAELSDAKGGPLDMSIAILEGLHARWTALMRTMTPGDFQRTFVHPTRGEVTLEVIARLYAWHGRHHAAHIGLCRNLSVSL